MKYFVCLWMAVSMAFAGFAAQDEDEELPVLIINGEYGDHTKIQPRSIVRVPLTCIYGAGAVEVRFTDDLGEAEVIVTSLTTGEQWFTVGAATETLTVQTPGEQGEYVVQIYAGGNAWYGCYTIE